jgi:hypothetical protein
VAATPDLPRDDLIKWFRDIVRRLSIVEQRSAFANTGIVVLDNSQLAQEGSITIPSGGVLEVDGGDVIMLDTAPSGTILFRLGVQDFADRGITIRRNDNTVALVVKDVFGTGSQSMLMYDRVGKITGGDSILGTSGIDAPQIPIPFIPVDYTSNATAQTTSSATFVALHEHRGPRQNPAMKPQFMVKCSNGTTAAEIQIYDVVNSAYLGGYLGSPAVQKITVPVATTAFTPFQFGSSVILPGLMGDAMNLQIHARVTAGAGSVSVAPVQTFGSGI